MSSKILVFYGSYRSDRKGISLANYIVHEMLARGDNAELIDAREVGLPMLDRMYKEFAPGTAPPAMEQLAGKIREADAFVFVVGEYNWGVQPGLKNLTDHFLEEWFWRPAAIASYSAGRIAGARSSSAWRLSISEMGMVPISSTLTVGNIGEAFDEEGNPAGKTARLLKAKFTPFAEDLAWWTSAAKRQRSLEPTPY
ncbi:MAG: NAD(P)H-dependent oxidoreductase [Rhizobiaceae bacterium]|nr:NAD(P)H-dependent oxidoreductase [Rhizobiaceae bacterium]